MTFIYPGFRFARCIAAALCALAWGVNAGALAAEDHSAHRHPAAAQTSAAYGRSTHDYRLPSVKLVRADGARVAFPADIDDGRVVLVNFIYTTCTAICPVMTQIFAAFQQSLGVEADKLRLVSVSIDPEQDRPRQLADYARQHHAGQNWVFYTGTMEASIAVQKAFDAYRGDKMNHTPLTLMRAAPGKPWVRLDGLATPADLMREYRLLVAEK